MFPTILNIDQLSPSFSITATNVLKVPANIGCTCPGNVLAFNCTVVGTATGNTVWQGTAFDCTANSVLLRHSRFESPGGASDECNNGRIVGRSLDVEGNCYTSQLTVAVSASFNNKTVSCIHNTGTGMITIDVSTLTVMQG